MDMQGVGYLVTLSIEISLFFAAVISSHKAVRVTFSCTFSVSPLACWSLQGHSVPTSEKPH